MSVLMALVSISVIILSLDILLFFDPVSRAQKLNVELTCFNRLATKELRWRMVRVGYGDSHDLEGIRH